MLADKPHLRVMRDRQSRPDTQGKPDQAYATQAPPHPAPQFRYEQLHLLRSLTAFSQTSVEGCMLAVNGGFEGCAAVLSSLDIPEERVM